VLFAEEIARKSLDVFDENVFIHYPCRPSTIFAFGDATHGKLGLEVATGLFENPTIIKKVLNKVRDIQQFNNALVIQLEDGTLYKSGFRDCWNATDKHQVKKYDKKAEIFGLGTRHTLIVNVKGQLQGEGVSNAGGMGTDVYENKSWTTLKLSVKEKVTQISCAYDFSFVISESGQLFCAGNNMLSKMNITNLNKFEKIDLGQGVIA
jgi:alpha-tubulin suppressor-like RCC1 family protein